MVKRVMFLMYGLMCLVNTTLLLVAYHELATNEPGAPMRSIFLLIICQMSVLPVHILLSLVRALDD